MILHTSLQELRQNINQRLSPKKTPHTSPWRASYGMSFMNILEKIDHVIKALHCMKLMKLHKAFPIYHRYSSGRNKPKALWSWYIMNALYRDLYSIVTSFTNHLCSQNPILQKKNAVIFVPNVKSGHNFAHVLTALLSRIVQNCDLIRYLISIWDKNVPLQGFNYELINSLWNGPLPN